MKDERKDLIPFNPTSMPSVPDKQSSAIPLSQARQILQALLPNKLGKQQQW